MCTTHVHRQVAVKLNVAIAIDGEPLKGIQKKQSLTRQKKLFNWNDWISKW